MQIAQDNATATQALGVRFLSESVGAQPLRRLQAHPAQWRGGRLRARQDRRRHDQGLPGGERLQGAASARIRDIVSGLTEAVVSALIRRQPGGGTFHIEDMQDQVELALMRSGEHDVARSYVLYREERAKARAQEKAARKVEGGINVVENGQRKLLDRDALARLVAEACEGLPDAMARPPR